MRLFAGQRPDEQVIGFYRRHWLMLAQFLIVVVILAVAPVIIRILIRSGNSEIFSNPDDLGTVLVTLGVYVYWMVVLLFSFTHWIDYYHDYWVITDKRIVSVEQTGLFSRKVSQVDLGRIQDASSEMHGVLPTFFHYGNVVVQSAGEVGHFMFEQVPRPNEIVATILAWHLKAAQQEPHAMAQAVQQGVTAAAQAVNPAGPGTPPATVLPNTTVTTPPVIVPVPAAPPAQNQPTPRTPTVPPPPPDFTGKNGSA